MVYCLTCLLWVLNTQQQTLWNSTLKGFFYCLGLLRLYWWSELKLSQEYNVKRVFLSEEVHTSLHSKPLTYKLHHLICWRSLSSHSNIHKTFSYYTLRLDCYLWKRKIPSTGSLVLVSLGSFYRADRLGVLCRYFISKV